MQRSINDFLNNQTVGWYWFDNNDTTSRKYLYADYAGLQNRIYGLNIASTYDGMITEKALSNGTAEVRIVLHAHNILMYVLASNWSTLLFGETPSKILGGATPTLGNADIDATFINSAPGAPIPDFGTIISLATKFSMKASAFGPLTAASGLGPDGTPGHAWTNQNGVPGKLNGHPSIDGYSVEYVKLQPVGNIH